VDYPACNSANATSSCHAASDPCILPPMDSLVALDNRLSPVVRYARFLQLHNSIRYLRPQASLCHPACGRFRVSSSPAKEMIMNALMESPPAFRSSQAPEEGLRSMTVDACRCPAPANTLTSSPHSPSISGI